VLAILLLPGWIGGSGSAPPRFESIPAAPLRIDPASAPWYEWALLEGIGEMRARRIVDHRRLHGPFRSPDDLRRIPGLPAGWVEKAAPYLLFPAGAAPLARSENEDVE
jgi:hypothetical protein